MPELKPAVLRLMIAVAMVIVFCTGDAQARRFAPVIGNGPCDIGPLANTRNDLIPVDARLDKAADIDLEAIARDACRTNVFGLVDARRSLNRGLSRVEPEDITLVASAAMDATAASDSLPVSIAALAREKQASLNALLQRVSSNCDGLDVLVGGSSRNCISPGSGARFRDCPSCPEVAVVPDGTLVMGATKDEIAELAREYPDRSANLAWEGPQSVTTVNAPFAVNVSHITRGEFAVFAKVTKFTPKGGCYTFNGVDWTLDPKATWQSPGFSQTDQHPVVCISWDDAVAYAKWLSLLTGHSYRLLSEAEIEYVSRANKPGEPRSRYFFGDKIRDLCLYGNSADEQASKTYSLEKEQLAPCDDGFAQTAPVARYRPNAWGLHDVFGNVWTWTSDCWNENHESRPRDAAARLTGDCTKRVVRGGSWSNAAIDLRSSVRDKNLVGDRSSNLGFRLGRDLD